MMQSIETMQNGRIADAISGRATGVLFFAGFGSLWLYNGISAMHRLNPISMAAIVAIFAALFVPAAMLRRASSKVTYANEADSQHSTEAKRTFARVNILQWTAIVAALVLFNVLHKQEFLSPVITFIVGAHLIPLARLFCYPAHYVTGGLLMFWATLIAIMLPGEMMPSLGALGTAAILLGSAAYTLASAGRAARSGFVSNRLSAHGV